MLFREILKPASLLLISALSLTSCASYFQRVTPVVDGELLQRCPDPNWIVVERTGNPIEDDKALGNERYAWGVEYAKCQARGDVLIGRIRTMMDH